MVMTDYISGFIAQLDAADAQLLLWLNGLHTPMLDQLMWIVSDKWVWIPFYLLLAGLIVRHAGWRRGTLCLVFIGLAVAATDQTCAAILRPMVHRLRPSTPDNPLSSMIHIVNGYRGGQYGFPSCHAANSFLLAISVSLYLRRRLVWIFMLAWAALVSYSRIYLGVHYPGDILCGMAVGMTYGVLFHVAQSRIAAATMGQTATLRPANWLTFFLSLGR